MHDVTAEKDLRGRATDPERSRERRMRAMRLAEARERLTTPGASRRAFDLQLTRTFATSRRGAALALALLALGSGAILPLWVPKGAAITWTALVLAAIACSGGVAEAFVRQAEPEARLGRWRRTFVLAEALQGAVWAGVALPVLGVEDAAAQIFVLFVLLVVGAVTAMISAPIPFAVYAGLSPLALAVLAFARPTSGFHFLPVVVMAGVAQAYFVVLARRLHSTALATLSAQAEKDELIVELEQSKLNSDEARRRAEEASLAKSRFLATMSHELRTPLNAILGFSEVMKGELFGPHTVAVYRDYSADIHSSGQHLLMLINEILDLSRIEAGRYDLREEPTSLALIVDDCRHLLALRAAKREITVEEKIEPNLPPVWADERAIRQVILNLLSNALKFTPQGGTVTLKVGWTAQGGQYVAIRDTGPGIPEAEIPIVMSSFGRGTLAQKNAEEGSGLGLPIVKGLVELHGGTFTLRSKVREGTEVIVILPSARVIDAMPQLDPGAPPATVPRPQGRRDRRPAA